MTSLDQMITIIKAENPTIQMGDDTNGYTPVSGADYDAQIQQWAEARLAKQAQVSAAQTARTLALAKLEALGLTVDDLAALGL